MSLTKQINLSPNFHPISAGCWVSLFISLTLLNACKPLVSTTQGTTATASAAATPRPHQWVSGSGDIYVSDSVRHTIRKVTASTGIITTYAGADGSNGSSGDGGAAISALLDFPLGI